MAGTLRSRALPLRSERALSHASIALFVRGVFSSKRRPEPPLRSLTHVRYPYRDGFNLGHLRLTLPDEPKILSFLRSSNLGTIGEICSELSGSSESLAWESGRRRYYDQRCVPHM